MNVGEWKSVATLGEMSREYLMESVILKQKSKYWRGTVLYLGFGHDMR